QLALGASVPPEKARLLPPLMTNIPPHGLVVPLGAVRPAGKVSLKLMPDRAVPLFGLLIRKLIVVVPLRLMLAAPNDLAIVGGAGVATETVAVLLAAPGPLSVEVMTPVVLFWTPEAVPVTVTLIV